MAEFRHQQSAHCESGVVSALARHHGVALSEPMSFGLGEALAFAYLPLLKVNEMPLISYRMPPRTIIKKLRRKLDLPFRFETFRSATQGEERLDQLLESGRPVGVQTSVFFLPYFPVNMRFHFNGHNLIVYGKDRGDYLVSDPVFETATRCAPRDLTRARFARGMLAPKGMLYFLDGDAKHVETAPLLRPAIRGTCRTMLQPLLPFIGTRGIRLLARRVGALAHRSDQNEVRRTIGHIVRMQEEIGTGGAGFRYLYAAFLQEAAEKLGDERLRLHSLDLTAIGDAWREFALDAARMSKGRQPLQPELLAQRLSDLSQREATFFRALKKDL